MQESLNYIKVMVMVKTSFFFTLAAAILAISLLHFMADAATDIKTDESALVALKLSVSSDPLEILAKNWSSAADICSWAGITCDLRHHRVASLNLSNMNLTGSIPPHLGNLSFLVSLDLRGNGFNGTLPEELGKLRRLEYLRLTNNILSGNIPQTLGFLSKLQVLSFTNNSFTGMIPPAIFNLSSLQGLYLSSNYLQGGIPKPNRVVYNLRILDLGDNQLEGSIHENLCTTFPNLEELFLYQNKIMGPLPKTLQDCSFLETLSVFENRISGSIPKEIGNLTMLLGRHVHNNSLTGEIPQELGNLVNLERIFLASNSLTGTIPSGIFNISTLTMIALAFNQLSGNLPPTIGYTLPNLENLKLHYNRLSGRIPPSITNCSQLRILALDVNRFSGPIPNNLGDLRQVQLLNLAENNLTIDPSSQELSFITSLANCQYLLDFEVSENPLNGVLPSSIGNLSSSLLYLFFPLCKLRGSIPQEVGNLSSVIYLTMFGNQLTGPIPQTIGNMQQIQELDLQENKINAIPNSLCELQNLGTLSLQDNQISGTIPACVANATSLRYLYIDNNKLSNNIPSSLWKLQDLLQLSLSGNSLSGVLSLEIGNLKSLLALDLSKNQFSGEIPSTIGGMVQMTDLFLAYNGFGGTIPDIMGSMVSLVNLNLSHNNLSGQIPKSLEKLRDLTSFDVSSNRLIGEIPSEGPFKNFTSQSFMFNEALCGGPVIYNLPPCPGISKTHGSRKKAIFLAVFIPLGISIAITSIIILILVRRNHKKHWVSKREDTMLQSLMPGQISYYELQRATNGYDQSNLLGSGSYGTVYKGILDNGTPVAVKIFNLQTEGAFKSFDTECEAFRNLRHRNLVKVINSCSNEEFRALVLEYMPQGSLEKFLYSHNDFLDIMQRLNIVIDVACALEYLHHGSLVPVVHCDIKPSNVLLDADMVAHLSDFGIAKLFFEGNSNVNTTTLATFGYIAPEYGMEGLVSTKCDVYSFGIMIMEIFTRVKPSDDAILGDTSLKDWVNDSMLNATVHKVIDANLITQPTNYVEKKLECVSSLLNLALRCSAESPSERLTMKEVVPSLNSIKVQFSAVLIG